MSYIYDVLANFNISFFEFYDWYDTDDIIHIKKLPIIKVRSDFFNTIKYHSTKVDSNLLEKIYKKCILFKSNKNKFNYVCALCDGRESIIVMFDSSGNVIGRSSMLIDEENEIIDISECLDFFDCSFEVNENILFDHFKTRYDLSVNNLIVDQLTYMNHDKLKYLYFDCFDEIEDDTNKMFDRIMISLKNDYYSISGKIYDFLKLTSINK